MAVKNPAPSKPRPRAQGDPPAAWHRALSGAPASRGRAASLAIAPIVRIGFWGFLAPFPLDKRAPFK